MYCFVSYTDIYIYILLLLLLSIGVLFIREFYLHYITYKI